MFVNLSTLRCPICQAKRDRDMSFDHDFEAVCRAAREARAIKSATDAEYRRHLAETTFPAPARKEAS